MQDLINRYRPEKLQDFWGGKVTKEIWAGHIERKDFPRSIIVSGGFGQGKTTLALILCNDIARLAAKKKGAVLGSDLRRLGPSDYDRKRISEMINSSYRYCNMCCPVVMFMDEAQRMPDKTIQELFLDPINYYEHVYFVFATVDIKDMNPALISRSTIFPVEPPPMDVLIEKLAEIAQKERIPIPVDSLIYLIEKSDLVPRSCLKNLECLYSCKEPLTIDVVLRRISANVGAKYAM